jgi:hypothetical protein
MGALVPRELKLDAGNDRRIRDFGVRKPRDGEEQQQEEEEKKTLTRAPRDLSRLRER